MFVALWLGAEPVDEDIRLVQSIILKLVVHRCTAMVGLAVLHLNLLHLVVGATWCSVSWCIWLNVLHKLVAQDPPELSAPTGATRWTPARWSTRWSTNATRWSTSLMLLVRQSDRNCGGRKMERAKWRRHTKLHIVCARNTISVHHLHRYFERCSPPGFLDANVQ